MQLRIKGWGIAFSLLLLASACTSASTKPEANQPTSSPEAIAAQQVSENQTTDVKTDAKIKIDGSSTVYPITQAIAGQVQLEKAKYKGAIAVSFSGTGGGFEKFCKGEIDISNASRPISEKEISACQANGVKFIELPIAYDALTVVVNVKNSWAENITVAELKKIWEAAAEGKITRWNQVRSNYPDQPINLYGPGSKSGTFDYFNEAILGKDASSRKDYIASEDDIALVRGVINDPNALGYFGYSYYKDNRGPIKALAVDGGKGPVLPSRPHVEQSVYQPLSRPLFIYVSADAAQSKPELKEFVNYYLETAPSAVSAMGYVPLPRKLSQVVQERFNSGKIGTVFAGKEPTDLQIQQLLEVEQKSQ